MLLDTSKPALAVIFVLLIRHLNIVLRVAPVFVVREETAIPSIQDVDFGIC